MKRLYLNFTNTILFIILMSSIITGQEKDKHNYVPDAATAIKIAEAVWLPIYGEKIFSNKPFVANLVNDNVWIVKGSFISKHHYLLVVCLTLK